MFDTPVQHLAISTERSPRAVVIGAAGELDVASAEQLSQALTEAARVAAGQVVLDLRELTFIDAAGIATLLRAKETCEATGRHLVLRSPHPRVVAVLDALDLTAAFVIDGSGPMVDLRDAPIAWTPPRTGHRR